MNGRNKSVFLSAEHQPDTIQTWNETFLTSQSSQVDVDRHITGEACSMPGRNIDLKQL